MSALAGSAPLQIRIIDRLLPALLEAKNSQDTSEMGWGDHCYRRFASRFIHLEPMVSSHLELGKPDDYRVQVGQSVDRR